MRLPTLCLAALLSFVLPACTSTTSVASASIVHPDRDDARVEYFVETPSTPGPWPSVIFLHGHQTNVITPGGEAFARWGVLRDYAQKGYLAVAISLPGFGGSTGPRDFAGPFTQHAVTAVMHRLEKDGQTNRGRMVIEGVSLGAVTGALVAVDEPGLAGLVLISGLYDLPAFLDEPRTAAAAAIRSTVLAQTDGSRGALAQRSALRRASAIKARTLILNGAQDDHTDAGQATRLAATINAAGGRAEVQVYPSLGHEIPFAMREPLVSAFIDVTLRR